jgi:addiction module HigA family antidote
VAKAFPTSDVNRIVNGRAAVSTEMALKLGAAFRTSPDFWLNAQKAVDLYRASEEEVELPQSLVRAS